MSEEFVNILQKEHFQVSSSNSSLPSSIPQQFNQFPSVEVVISHLKLLRAFKILQDGIVSEKGAENENINWRIYLANASRRFIVFVCSLKRSLKDTPGENNRPKVDFLPPLDVCSIWYSILLNPGDFYDTFKHLQFEAFMRYPFPLELITQAIDNKTFEYSPSTDLQKNYLDLVSLYFQDEPNRLIYSLGKAHILQSVSIRCPICDNILVKNVPLCNEDNTGFQDDDFHCTKSASSNCQCEFGINISHEELAKRKLSKDLKSGELCGIYKGYLDSNDLSVDLNTVKEQVRQEIIQCIEKSDEGLQQLSFDDLRTLLKKGCMKYIVMNTLKKKSSLKHILQDIIDIVIDSYANMKLIYLTMTKNGTDDDLYIDLSGYALQQDHFIRKMNQIDWLRSPFIKEIISESCRRYTRWFKLGNVRLLEVSGGFNDRKILVPTLDIDLVWRTHNLSLSTYFQTAIQGSKVLIDVIDNPDQAELDITFTETALRYKQRYNEEYLICFCNLCVSVRSKVIPKYESWAERNKTNDMVIKKPPEYPKLEQPPDYGNSTKLDLPPDYGPTVQVEITDESSEADEEAQLATQTDTQPDTPPDYRSRSQLFPVPPSPPDYGNVAEVEGPPDYDKESQQRELPPNYTAVPLFAISDTYPYFCADDSSAPKVTDSIIIGGCTCRGDRGCGGGKSVRYGKLKATGTIQLT